MAKLVRYIEVVFIYFTVSGVKKIVGYTEVFVIKRFVISRLHFTDLHNT